MALKHQFVASLAAGMPGLGLEGHFGDGVFAPIAARPHNAAVSSPVPSLQIDLAQVERVLGMLYEPGDWFFLAWYDDSKKKGLCASSFEYRGAGKLVSGNVSYLQPDPIKKDPMSYGYVANSPLNWTDPTGEDIKIDYGRNEATIMIDAWDINCCQNQGSRKFRFSTAPRSAWPQPPWWSLLPPRPIGQVERIWPPVMSPTGSMFDPPLPRDGSSGSYCTTCQQDSAAWRAAHALIGVAQQPYDRATAQMLFDSILIAAGVTPGGSQTPCESSQRPR